MRGVFDPCVGVLMYLDVGNEGGNNELLKDVLIRGAAKQAVIGRPLHHLSLYWASYRTVLQLPNRQSLKQTCTISIEKPPASY